MFNKEVCRKCYTEHLARDPENGIINSNYNMIKFDEDWEKGMVWCLLAGSPFQKVFYCVKSLSPPPECCPNGLEHLVANRQDEIDKKG